MTQAKQSIPALYDFIKERQANPVAGSYTDYLFTKGLDKILKKIGEESTEVIVAAKNPDDPAFILEVADLTYHVLVLMVERGIKLPPNWLVAKERRADCKNGQKSRNINALKRASLIDKA